MRRTSPRLRSCRSILAGAIAITSIGCAGGTYVTRRGDDPPRPPTATLHGALTVWHRSRLPTDLLHNVTLDDFGALAKPKLAAFLRDNGYDEQDDPELARKLDFLRIDDKGLQIATGEWRDPQGSTVSAVWLTSIFGGNKNKEVAATLAGGRLRRYAFHEIQIGSYGFYAACFWVWGWPRVTVTTVVLDDQGERVFAAQGAGDGGGSSFGVDASPQNLARALDAALAELASKSPRAP